MADQSRLIVYRALTTFNRDLSIDFFLLAILNILGCPCEQPYLQLINFGNKVLVGDRWTNIALVNPSGFELNRWWGKILVGYEA